MVYIESSLQETVFQQAEFGDIFADLARSASVKESERKDMYAPLIDSI
jgi:hypothetical protein